MKQFLYGALIFLLTVISCKEKHEISHYYSGPERDSLLADIITYIYVKPKQATWQTRFEPRYRQYYVSQLKNFNIEKYTITDEGVHYFYLIRPARSATGTIRGVGGHFRLDAEGMIYSFEEVFNTPVGDRNELRIKGDELFRWMIRHGHVNEYLKNPDYIEWPSPQTYYDTLQHEWLIKPGM